MLNRPKTLRLFALTICLCQWLGVSVGQAAAGANRTSNFSKPYAGCDSTTFGEREEKRKAFHEIEGTYQSPVKVGTLVKYWVEVIIILDDIPCAGSLNPGLVAHYRRMDIHEGNGIGEYILQIDYDPGSGAFVMQSVSAERGLPGSSLLSIRGHVVDHSLWANIRDKKGYMGTISASATEIPPFP